MRLAEGENYLVSARDGLAICQIWTRPDLSFEEGAQNAQQMVSFLVEVALRVGTSYRGVIFDMRRGPPVFGPKTRAVLAGLLAHSIERRVRLAVITGESATQVLQFRSLCSDSPSFTQVFESEPAAVRWLRAEAAGKR